MSLARTIAIVAVAVCTQLIAAPAWSGVVFEIETKDLDASPPTTGETQVYAEAGNLKMSVPADGRGRGVEIIFRGDRREMVVVDHDDKTYTVVDETALEAIGTALEAIGQQVDSAMSQHEETLRNLPEEQRAWVEEMMKERMPPGALPAAKPTFEVRRSGERATHNGYPCVKYVVSSGDRVVRELWVTAWDNVEGGEEAKEAFHGMADFFARMMESMTRMAGSLPGGSFDGLTDNSMAWMKELDGFPVVTRGFGADGSLEDEATLRSSRRVDLDPADFEPPAGYRRLR